MGEALFSAFLTCLMLYGVLMAGIPTFFPFHFGIIFYLLKKYILKREYIVPDNWFELSLRVLYGLINPMIYLLLQRSSNSEINTRYLWVNKIAILYLLTYWSIFLFARRAGSLGDKLWRSVWIHRGMAISGLVLIIIYWIKDDHFKVYRSHEGRIFEVWGWFCTFLPLFLIPSLILFADFRKASEWAKMPLKVVPTKLGRTAKFGMVTFSVLFVLSALIPLPKWYLKKQVVLRSEMISKAGKIYGVDPRLIKAIIIVGNNRHNTVLRKLLKDLFPRLWVWDAKNNFGFTEPSNHSIGFCQIKPGTAFEYFWLYQTNKQKIQREYNAEFNYFHAKNPEGMFYKEGRGNLSVAGEDYIVPEMKVDFPAPLEKMITRKEIYEYLGTEEGNLHICAFIIRLVQEQWKAKGFNIENRPEIIATIYNIGFKYSRPNPNPRPNDFGKAVAEEIRRSFPSR